MSFLIVVVLFCCMAAACSSKQYNAIFNFGDSMSDAGNLFADGVPPLPSDSPANIFDRFPYGMTYFSKATGRCSDGRLVVDFLAQALGLPLPPPSKARQKDFRRGANMAIIGATVLESSFIQSYGYGGNINASMNAQLSTFQQLLPSICGTPENCKAYLAESLFVFGELGENDYTVQFGTGSSIDEAIRCIPNIVNAIRAAMEKLIKLGAVDIVVPNIAPVGCFPFYLAVLENPDDKDDYDHFGCSKKFNNLFDRHNSLLQSTLLSLQKKYQHTRIMYADFAGHIYQMVHNPKIFGLDANLDACCGQRGAPYNFNFSALCGMEGADVCLNPSNHIIWDGFHLTEGANKRVAYGCLNGPYCYPPILQ